MSIKAFDTESVTTGHAHDILNLGYGAVGLYLRADRSPLEAIQGLHSVGLKIFSIWEKGYPTAAGYFTADQGTADGQAAAEYALSVSQPSETTISPCVDYDSNPAEVEAYLVAFHDAVKEDGYYSLPYGNGATLGYAIAQGFAVGGYLSQSSGFSGYQDFLPDAAIVQSIGAAPLGLNGDPDEVVLESIQVTGDDGNPITISVLW
jgi:hypothetical protein